MKAFYRLIWAIPLVVLLVACCIAEAVPQESPDQATASEPLPMDITNLTPGKAPSYRGVTPGISHKSGVLAQWGEPNVIRAYGAYESLHYFHNGLEEYFLIKNGVVQSVTSNSEQFWLTYNGGAATADELYQVLGTPAVVTPTLGYLIQVFPQYGLAIPEYFVVRYYQFFVPMDLEEYQTLWGKFPLEYDPFPPIPSVETVGIKPGETTREQVAELLGNPDYIAFQDSNAPWLYYVEPDMLGRLHIFFDEHNVVETMAITPIYSVPRPLLLGDAVNRYGEPDMVQLLPGFEGQKYETLALVYLSQGVRVSTRCITPACELVKESAVVNQKWYFRQSLSLEECQAMFSYIDSAYVEWHGFDE